MRWIPDISHPSNWNRDERNVYAKVFAGFLFDGDEAHEKILFEVENRLLEVPEVVRAAVPERLPRPVGELVVGFDNPVHDLLEDVNRSGELADVVVWGDREFATVEAKVATDWRFDKDVANQIRDARRVADRHGLRHVGHCLVVAERKWEHVRRLAKHPGSNWRRVTEWLEAEPGPLVILTWEQLAGRARETCVPEGVVFDDWLRAQVDVCQRAVEAMPPRELP